MPNPKLRVPLGRVPKRRALGRIRYGTSSPLARVLANLPDLAPA